MAEHWITASQALEIAGDPIALCKGLHIGAIQARARLLKIDDSAVQDFALPAQMWWAHGHAALDQDWQNGDFATWLDRDQRVEAFGVTFALSGVLEMIDAEHRPSFIRSMSVAGNPAWITARDAQVLAAEQLGFNPGVSGQVILEKARLGLVVARAMEARGSTGDRDEADWTWEECEWDVPIWFWDNFTTPGSSAQDWQTGKFSGGGRSPTSIRSITLSGLYFHRESLEALGPPKPVTNSETQRGRKPSYEWAEAISAIWGRLNRGELRPKVQADVETALTGYLTKGDKSPSESTARPFAKLIWDEFEKP